MLRIAIVGAGNAGCITALNTYIRCLRKQIPFEIIIYHNLKEQPIEKVGQGTIPGPPSLISQVLEIDWYDNPIDATFKTGLLYENWGKRKDTFFHPFSLDLIAIHFTPEKLTKEVLKFKAFKVIEKEIKNPENEIDADLIFDCRGRHNRDKDNYEKLINPINAVITGRKNKRDKSLTYTKAIATPNGWTFVIPNKNNISYGYLYNNKITSKEEAINDFLKRFKLKKIEYESTFENYIAKDIFINERTVLQGNKCAFLEPLEATALPFYLKVCNIGLDYFFNDINKNKLNEEIKYEMKCIETFILWHYQFGSKYDTPFWSYAKSLPFDPDEKFKNILRQKLLEAEYGQWQGYSFKNWIQNIAIP